MKFLPPIIVFLAIAFLTWKFSRLILVRVFKVEVAMAEAIAWALTMIVPLMSLYIWGAVLMK